MAGERNDPEVALPLDDVARRIVAVGERNRTRSFWQIRCGVW
jgi:hypothetical protein